MTDLPAVALDPAANYEAAEVALWLRERPRTFTKKLARRIAQQGFPRPIAQWGRKVWSGQALIDWRENPQKSAPLPAGVTPLGPLLAQRAAMAARQGARKRA